VPVAFVGVVLEDNGRGDGADLRQRAVLRERDPDLLSQRPGGEQAVLLGGELAEVRQE
jgi:hypothetical protein